MCYAIYIVLIGLFFIYSDSVIEEFALSLASGDGEWMVVAIGWEMLLPIWPVLVLLAVISSAVTFFITRHRYHSASHSSRRTAGSISVE